MLDHTLMVAFVARSSSLLMPAKPEKVDSSFLCRPGCGACCVIPSISSSIPGMPNGKLAGERCIQLDDQNHCKIFGLPERPAVCLAFQATVDVCGESDAQAYELLLWLEQDTLPRDA